MAQTQRTRGATKFSAGRLAGCSCSGTGAGSWFPNLTGPIPSSGPAVVPAAYVAPFNGGTSNAAPGAIGGGTAAYSGGGGGGGHSFLSPTQLQGFGTAAPNVGSGAGATAGTGTPSYGPNVIGNGTPPGYPRWPGAQSTIGGMPSTLVIAGAVLLGLVLLGGR